jgi:hypothetical protein
MSKIIAITGATGAQGGSLARAILSDPQSHFKVRAITRNPKSENAMKLVEMGAEVVQADLDDVNSLRCAFEGAYGVFCLTNFWEHFSPEKEIEQAGNMAQAAKDAGAHHVVWSTFNDTRNWVPLDANIAGKIQSPALRFKRRSKWQICRSRSPHNLFIDFLLLGEYDLLWYGFTTWSRRRFRINIAYG